MLSSSQCKTALTCARLQTTLSHVTQYWAKNEDLQKCGSTFRHGTVVAPIQRLFEKEAAGIESPKMHSSSQCKNCTNLCGTPNFPVSCKPVQVREQKFA